MAAPHDQAEEHLDALEALLREMKFPDPAGRPGSQLSAYDPMRQLFVACRSTVHHHRRNVEAGLVPDATAPTATKLASR